MQTILYNIGQVLGITIIHSLWQGLLAWVVLRLVFIFVPSWSSMKRYNLAVVVMLMMFVCFVYTLCAEIAGYNWVRPANAAAWLPYLGLSINPRYVVPNQSVYSAISRYLPYISAIYIAGLAVNLLKFGHEWDKIRRIKQTVIPAGQMQQFINTFAKKLDITWRIQLNFSELIDVPCLIGLIKPVILLPVSLATYLSACEIEAILLHELAHIKRHDYFINLLQQAVSIMLFFNPFVQFVNSVINEERENSCDDLVVEKTGKPLIYARALLKLEEGRASNLKLALAATGKKYHLLNRIERIMKTKKPIGNVRHLALAILILAGSLGSIAWLSPKAAEGKTIAKKAKSNASYSSAHVVAPADTINAVVLVSDTTKRKHKGKIVLTDKHGKRKEYDSIDSLPPEWRAKFEAIKKETEEMHKKFDNPEWKAQMALIKKQGEEMRKKFESPEWEAQAELMKKQGEEMRKKFDGPEWKAQMELIKKQGEEFHKKFDSPEWKNQMLAMKGQAEEMRKKFESPQWKKSMEEIKRQGEEMRKKFDGPEWKAQMELIKKQGEEMKKRFNSPEWRAQMELMRKKAELFEKGMGNWKWDRDDSVKEQRDTVRK